VQLFWLTVAAVAAIRAARRSAGGPGGPAAARELSPPPLARFVGNGMPTGAQAAAGFVASGARRVGRPGLLTTMGLTAGAATVSRGLSRCET
jgi:hypothetical protein